MSKKINIDSKKLVKLHSQGLSNSAIARLLGCSYPVISSNLRFIGLESNSRPSVVNYGDPFSCVGCGKIQDKDCYEKNRGGSYRVKCKKCRNRALVIKRFSNVDNRISKKIISARDRNKKNNAPFNIDSAFMKALLIKQDYKCFYSDEPIIFYEYGMTPSRKVAPSIDRIIPELGYTKGNVVWCHDRINLIKNDMTLDEMKKWMPDWYERIMFKKHIYHF